MQKTKFIGDFYRYYALMVYLFKKRKMQNIKELHNGESGRGLLIERDGYVSFEGNDSLSNNKPLRGAEFLNDWKIPYPYIVDVILTKYDTPNANGRIYPEAIMKRENEAYQSRIRNRQSLGEYSHPDDAILNGERATHIITETRWDKKTLVGKMELLLSWDFVKNGRINCLGDLAATQLFFQNIKLGVSTRGLGSLKEDKSTGLNIVQDDYTLIGWDIVTDPSSKDSWICTEPTDVSMYVENAEKANKKKLIEEKINKLNTIL